MERDVDAGSEVADHLFAIEGDESGAAVGEVVGEKAAADAEGVAGPGNVDIDFLNTNFEDVAGLGFLDGDGAGEDVAAGTFFGGGDLGVDVVDVRGDVGGGDAEGFEARAGAAGGEGLDGDGVAGLDGENGLRSCGVIAQATVVGVARRVCGACWAWDAGMARRATAQKAAVRARMVGMRFYISQWCMQGARLAMA